MKTKQELLAPIAEHYEFTERQKNRIYDVIDRYSKNESKQFLQYAIENLLTANYGTIDTITEEQIHKTYQQFKQEINATINI